MKLNPDCTRDILLLVESCQDCYMDEFQIPNELLSYSYEEILYHAKHCNQSGYFASFKYCIDDSLEIYDLSPEGHLILEYIRENQGFNKVKHILMEKGLPFALPSIKAIIELLV